MVDFQIAVQRKCMKYLIPSEIFNNLIYRHLQKCLYKGLCPKLSINKNIDTLDDIVKVLTSKQGYVAVIICNHSNLKKLTSLLNSYSHEIKC